MAGKLSKQEERATGGSDAHTDMVGILFWMSTYDSGPSDSGKLITFKNTLTPDFCIKKLLLYRVENVSGFF